MVSPTSEPGVQWSDDDSWLQHETPSQDYSSMPVPVVNAKMNELGDAGYTEDVVSSSLAPSTYDPQLQRGPVTEIESNFSNLEAAPTSEYYILDQTQSLFELPNHSEVPSYVPIGENEATIDDLWRDLIDDGSPVDPTTHRQSEPSNHNEGPPEMQSRRDELCDLAWAARMPNNDFGEEPRPWQSELSNQNPSLRDMELTQDELSDSVPRMNPFNELNNTSAHHFRASLPLLYPWGTDSLQIIRDNNFYNPHERHAIATGAYAVQARNPLYINDGDTPFHNQEAVGHEQDQSSAGAAGISQTIESNASTTDRRRLAATNEQTHQQQRLTPRKRPATSSSSGSQSIRRCLKCRKEKKAKRCIPEHRTYQDETTLRESLTRYSMVFIPSDMVSQFVNGMLENVATTHDITHDDLLNGPSVRLSLGVEQESFTIEEAVNLYPNILQSNPLISAILPGFDSFVLQKIWTRDPDKLNAKLTPAQATLFRTLRLFCGYLLLLHHLNEVEISYDNSQVHTAKLIAILLMHSVMHRLNALCTDLKGNLVQLVERQDDNHNVVATALEIICEKLRVKTPLNWSCENPPALPQLRLIHERLNQRIGEIVEQLYNIEREFSPQYRVGRLQQHPTTTDAKNLSLPSNCRIHFQIQSQSNGSSSVHGMGSGSGSLNVHSVIDLLLSVDVQS